MQRVHLAEGQGYASLCRRHGELESRQRLATHACTRRGGQAGEGEKEDNSTKAGHHNLDDVWVLEKGDNRMSGAQAPRGLKPALQLVC